MTRVKTIQLRTSDGWATFTQRVDNDNPTCELCGARLWAMGKTIYCDANAPQHAKQHVPNIDSPVATEFEIEQNSNGHYFCTLVDYYQGTKPAKRTQLPQLWDTYREAHLYGFWYIEQSKLPISQGFSTASLEAALNA